MKKRMTVVLGLAMFLAGLAASVRAADDPNDFTKVPAMIAGMTDEQAVQFARNSIAALYQLSLSPEKQADRLTLLALGLVSGASTKSMPQVAAAVLSAVRPADLARIKAVVALVVSVRQADVAAASKTAPAAVADPGMLGPQALDSAIASSAQGAAGTLSSHSTIITPPSSLPDGRGVPGAPPAGVPARPPELPPAPFYEGQ